MTTTETIFGNDTDDPFDLTVRAYVWGFPLVEAAKIRLLTTNPDEPFVPRPPTSTGAPLNRFGHARVPADPSFRNGVGVNVDTLYSSARLDLAGGPFLFEAPDFGSRYYTFQLAFADSSAEQCFGQRSHGGRLPPILILGPGDTSTVPSGVLPVRSPTRYVLVAGRILFDPHHDDLRAVHDLQDALVLRPFRRSAATTAVPDQRRLADPSRQVDQRLVFLEQLGNVLRDWHIPTAERDLITSFERIGLTPHAGFVPEGLSEADVHQVIRGIADGKRIVRRRSLDLGENVNGWTINYRGCRFGAGLPAAGRRREGSDLCRHPGGGDLSRRQGG